MKSGGMGRCIDCCCRCLSPGEVMILTLPAVLRGMVRASRGWTDDEVVVVLRVNWRTFWELVKGVKDPLMKGRGEDDCASGSQGVRRYCSGPSVRPFPSRPLTAIMRGHEGGAMPCLLVLGKAQVVGISSTIAFVVGEVQRRPLPSPICSLLLPTASSPSTPANIPPSGP